MHMPAGMTRWQREQLLQTPSAAAPRSSSGAPADQPHSLDALGFDTQEYEFGVRLPERLLMRLDRFSMSNGVEARVPFLDRELVEFGYRLAPALKLQHGSGKAVLREAVADVVPARVLARAKQGFDAPVVDWFGAKMGDLFSSLIGEDAIRAHFDTVVLRSLLGAPDPVARRLALWPVLNFALWHLAWIEGRDLEAELEGVLG